MAGISINAPQGNPIDTLSQSSTQTVREGKPKQPGVKPVAASEARDIVSLSAAARLSPTTTQEGSSLSDADAQSQSVNLRQLLERQSLSGTAKQNQAILSLLR